MHSQSQHHSVNAIFAMHGRLLIVGGSYAACEIASSARDNGYDGEIVVASEECELPYHRPPLSKAFLKSDAEAALPLKAAVFYEAHKIETELGTRVMTLDLRAKSASLSNGTTISFDKLALATGARARKLSVPGADLANVHYLRSAADARLLKSTAKSAVNVAVIGAGFIGLEVAAALAAPQRKVTVIEATDRLLRRVVAPELSEFFSELHAAHGVRLLTSSTVKSLEGENGAVTRVFLQDGSAIEADIVVVGIGSVPNCELAEQIGLACNGGIVVDDRSRTSRPEVVASGDCAVFRGPLNPAGVRLESVQNALDQSRIAGAVVAGTDRRYESLPWFWSDQYNIKLQIAGLPFGATERIVKSRAQSEISVFHFRDDVCICIESVNRAREHMAARRVLPQRNTTKAALQAVDFEIAALMKAAPGNVRVPLRSEVGNATL
jgi:3-phenylpropionate/trans-cinnamate dioxygenase ferredoxin reductase component